MKATIPIPELPEKHKARFWAKVRKSEDGCWEWTACKNKVGRGCFGCFGTVFLAPRISWTIANGIIPDGFGALHKCDNPSCVRPDHLFLGTPKDNADDRQSKGRGNQPTGDKSGARKHPEKVTRGEGHYAAKVTDENVRLIRARYSAGGVSQTALAKEFRITQAVVSKIILRTTWKHIV